MADNDVRIKVSLDGADGVQKGLKGVGDGASEADSKLGGLVSKGLKGAGTAVAGFAVAAGAAGVALATSVVSAYSDYQQNVGGIEKLFGDSAGKMEKYAGDAYKTAGLSANDYMSQATSFSAALIKGLGGDQAAAADKANQAITDMSDNANVFGSNIGDIQNAYQGFAKQNFTMLDNLKLGYGGTASEMARLVNDSGVMGDSFTATADNVNSISYDKIIDAIHKVQDNMGITGDTAKEASHTVAGSVASMQGAYQNFLAGLGDPDADIEKLAQNLVTSFQSVVTNVAPVITQLGGSIEKLGPQLGTMISGVVGSLATVLPAVLSAGVSLVTGLLQGITTALPSLVTALLPGLLALVTSVLTIAPQLLTAGLQAVIALAEGIATALPTLIPLLVTGVVQMIQALVNALPLLLQAGLDIITGLITGLIAAMPSLIAALPQIIQGIVTFLTSAIPAIIQAGIALLTALVKALPTIITAVTKAIPLIITALTTATISPSSINAIMKAGLALLSAMIKAQPQINSAIVAAIPKIISALVSSIGASHGSIASAGLSLLKAIVQNVSSASSTVVSGVKGIITSAVTAVKNGVTGMTTAGLNLVKGIASGITSGTSWLLGVIGSFAKTITSGVKSFFGIHSPSKLWEEEVGAFLPAGLGVGVTLNADAALGPIKDLNGQIMSEIGNLQTSVAYTTTQSLVPMQATAQQQSPLSVTATLDQSAIGSAISDAFAANDRTGDQASVSLSSASINTLATAIVDSIRTQSRQGVSILG